MYTIIYDSTGIILMTTSQTGYGKISAIEAEVPDGYYVASVNPETGEPVLKEIPKSSEQAQIDDLKKIVAQLQEAAALQQQITDAIIGADETESEGTV